MASFLSTERLARTGARRPWVVVGIWLVLFLAGGFLASGVGGVLTNEMTFISEPDSVKGFNLIEDRLRGPDKAKEFVIVRSDTMTVDDAQFRAFVEGLTARLRDTTNADGSAVVDPKGTFSFYDTQNAGLVSSDRRTTIIQATLLGEMTEAGDNVKPLLDVVHAADKDGQTQGLEVLTGGVGSINNTFNRISEEDLQSAEVLGLPVALVILVVVFGALVAAGVPILLALLSITMAVGTATVVGQAFELSFFAVNMITMIGLAVGIDYTLFIVERFREERARGLSVDDAVSRAGDTASRAVFFSGGTVVIALVGMLIVPTTIFRSLAIGAIAAVVWSVILALTLLPAILRLLGDRVNAPRIRFLSRRTRSNDVDHERGFWAGTARVVMARPWLSVFLSGSLLIAAAIPYFTINIGSSGVSAMPDGQEVKRQFEILQREFSVGLLSPTQIVVDAPNVNDPRVQSGIQRLIDTLKSDPAFGPATVETSPAGDLLVISSAVNGEATGSVAQDTVGRLRGSYIPSAFAGTNTDVLVTGDAAFNRDFFTLVDDFTPIVFVFVLSFSFLLLMLAFRSLVLPAKAVLMNLLSVGASYGLLVLVFQHGVGNELFGFRQVDAIDAWIPLFMFSVLFGLSMDYHVFLLSRIRERFDQTGDNRGSVSFGLRSTARIITGAALIMVAVFASFASGQLVMFQQMGFGLAVAVILDATVVRMVLVPASMQLLGRANWYLPRWLQWLPDVRVEGALVRQPAGANALATES